MSDAMNFNIIEKESVVITDELYDEIKQEYVFSELTVEEIRKKHNLTHIDWKNLSNRIRNELGVKGRPQANARHYYRVGDKWRIIKWVDGKTVHIGEVSCSEQVVKMIVKLCQSANWDIDECKKIVKGGWYYLI